MGVITANAVVTLIHYFLKKAKNKIKAVSVLKLSDYNYVCKLENDKKIIFNTFSGAILRVDSDFFDTLTTNFMNFNQEIINKLFKLGIIVNDDFDEKAVIAHDRTANIYSRESITYRILTTTACNARCFYCYEEDFVISTMSMQTAEKVIEFICNNSKSSNEIKIQWFGGEPLLNTKVMYHITKKIIEYCNLYKKKYNFSIVTNGILLNKIKLDSLHLDRIQISLDGTNKEYNERKNFIKEKNAFFKVIDNINMVTSKKINVSIRLNYDKNNYIDILNLIDYLSNNLVNKKYVHIYPYPLFGTYCDHFPNTNSTSKDDLLNIYIKLYKSHLLLIENLTNLRYQPSRCFACNANSFVISPEGNLSKCPVSYANNVGDVFNGIEYNSEYFKWVNNSISEKCENCTFLPLCQGGCMAGQLGKHSVRCFLNKLLIDDLIKLVINSKK